MTMETNTFHLKMDNYEVNIVIRALNDLRTKLLKEEKTTDAVDDIMLKYIKVLQKKERNEAR